MADAQPSIDGPVSVDKPNESENNIGESNTEDEEDAMCGIRPSQICSPATSKHVLTSPKLKCVLGSANKAQFPSSSLLRPPQLGTTTITTQKTPFVLNPSRLNPFAKSTQDENEKQNGSNVNGDSPKFLPLVQSEKKAEERQARASTSSTTSAQNCGFVFGENIHDRVVSDAKPDEARTKILTEEVRRCCCSHANSNGSSDMLFTSAIKETTTSSPATTTTTTTAAPRETKSLSESAREYEESRAVKRKYEEVEVRTGEEGETNVIQITCKLFAYDNGNWQERGRGVLRLNDRQASEEQRAHSRLVFRTSGSLRVVLNTKIWAKMNVQQASPKSIRLTAFDNNGDVKVFLATGQPDEMKQLLKHLDARVNKEIAKVDEEPSPKKSANESN